MDGPSHVQKGNCLLWLLDNVADFNQNNNKLLMREIKMIKFFVGVQEQGAWDHGEKQWDSVLVQENPLTNTCIQVLTPNFLRR